MCNPKKLVCLLMFFALGIGCNPYIDVYFNVNKIFFCLCTQRTFVNASTNEEVTLKVLPYTCEPYSSQEVKKPSGGRYRYHTELCGQSFLQAEDKIHLLDYSISVLSNQEECDGAIYFSSDVFTIAPYPDNADTLSITIDNQIYTGVYRLFPDAISSGHQIREIYYDREIGILRVMTETNVEWNYRQ